MYLRKTTQTIKDTLINFTELNNIIKVEQVARECNFPLSLTR